MKAEPKRCINCIENKNCKDSRVSWIFFAVGIVATIAIRAVTILMHLNPVYGKLAWYVGVSGFVIFFIYKFKILQASARLIQEKKLLERITKPGELTAEDSSIIKAILCSLSSQKERINYFFIFALSVIALLFAMYIDLFK